MAVIDSIRVRLSQCGTAARRLPDPHRAVVITMPDWRSCDEASTPHMPGSPPAAWRIASRRSVCGACAPLDLAVEPRGRRAAHEAHVAASRLFHGRARVRPTCRWLPLAHRSWR